MSDEEVTQKLAQLKQYSREFDWYEARWKATGGKKDAYEAMCTAERNYIALSEWLWAQGIAVFWDKQMQEYIALSPIHVQ